MLCQMQAELLKQCLSCWSSEASGCPNAVTFQKLAAFIQSQTSFSWGSTIEVVQAAGFEEDFVLRRCEELIVRSAASHLLPTLFKATTASLKSLSS